MGEFLTILGYDLAPQREAEILVDRYLAGDAQSFISYIRTSGSAFQDVPFSIPGFYKYAYSNFKNSKFILTVRDDSDQWYDSMIDFHSHLFGKGNVPKKEDLRTAEYVAKGWIWRLHSFIYPIHEDDPYDRSVLQKVYDQHRSDVEMYFANKPNQLLIVNLADPESKEKICAFLGKPVPKANIPWVNSRIKPQ